LQLVYVPGRQPGAMMNLTVTLSLGFFLLISSTAAWAGINPDAGRRDGYRACWSVIGGSDPDCPFRTAEAACEFHAEVNRQKPFDYVQKVSSTGGAYATGVNAFSLSTQSD
ncbi:MAG: hypothetical protein AAFX94_10130, partial [Myxococcota bacterium]